MDAIADDYEDLPMVLSTVRGWMKEEGQTATDPEVIAALLGLIREGSASAYRPIVRSGLAEIDGEPSPDEIPTAWFFLTKRGKDEVLRE